MGDPETKRTHPIVEVGVDFLGNGQCTLMFKILFLGLLEVPRVYINSMIGSIITEATGHVTKLGARIRFKFTTGQTGMDPIDNVRKQEFLTDSHVVQGS